MKKDIRNPNFFEGHLLDMLYKDGGPAFPDRTRCRYSHLKKRYSISKKMWLNDVNDIFYFVTESVCKWELCLALLVKSSEWESEHWLEGKQIKFLKKELKFSYPQKSSNGTSAGRWHASACRICRLPFENFSTLPEKRDQLIPVSIFAEGPKVPDHIYALLGRISLLEGSGRDVRKLIREAEATPGLRVLVGQPFLLQYTYTGSPMDDEDVTIQQVPTKRKATRQGRQEGNKRQASRDNTIQAGVSASPVSPEPSGLYEKGAVGVMGEGSDASESDGEQQHYAYLDQNYMTAGVHSPTSEEDCFNEELLNNLLDADFCEPPAPPAEITSSFSSVQEQSPVSSSYQSVFHVGNQSVSVSPYNPSFQTRSDYLYQNNVPLPVISSGHRQYF